MKFRFNCSDCDDNGDPIPNTCCGDLDVINIHLYNHLDRAGQQIYISFDTSGKFFFTNDQERYLEVYWSKDAIINLVERNTNHGRNLDIETCPKCHNDVTIELIEDSKS